MRVQVNLGISKGSGKLLHAVRGAPFRQFIRKILCVVGCTHGRGANSGGLVGIMNEEISLILQQLSATLAQQFLLESARSDQNGKRMKPYCLIKASGPLFVTAPNSPLEAYPLFRSMTRPSLCREK
jgi:hypothetical protein